MTHLFKKTDLPINQDYHTIAQTDFKTYYPNVNISMDWLSVEPYARKAVEKYIKPYLGDFYEDVYEALIDDPITTDAKMKRLGEYLKFALANYTIYDMLPHNNTVISDMGVMQNSNERAIPVESWRYKNTRWNCMLEADAMMDVALEYLFKEKAHFVGYHHIMPTVFVPNTSTLQQYANISGRRAYISMSTYLTDGDDEVRCILGDQYDDFVTKYSAGTLSDEEKGLVRKIQAYICDYALEKAISRLSIMVDGDGLKLLSSTDSFNLRSNALTSFGAEGPTALKRELKIDIARRKNGIINYMSANRDDFELWYSGLSPDSGKMVLISPDCIGGISIM